MSQVPKVKLFNGLEMPVLGLGTGRSKDVKGAVEFALEQGYRHIDTATAYRNEEAIGEVLGRWIAEGKVAREELFITTKLPTTGNRPEDVASCLDTSLKRLQLSYVDLYLVHDPFTLKGNKDNDSLLFDSDGNVVIDKGDIPGVWKAMEEQVDAGKAKSIGISNFNSVQIETIMKNCRIQPANHQIEIHAHHQQRELRAFCEKHNISVCAYSPLGAPHHQPKPGETRLIESPVVTAMATRLGKTPAQILLRHLLQNNIFAIPKSEKPDRIKANLQVFNFELSEEDMKSLDYLDRGRAGSLHVYTELFPGITKCPEYQFNIPF